MTTRCLFVLCFVALMLGGCTGRATGAPMPASTARTAPGTSVPKWAVHEIVLTAENSYANPYVEGAVVAALTGPEGDTLVVPGFWDGGNTWRIRFTPTAEGTWTYETTSDDPGLDGQRGALRVTGPPEGTRGFVRVDAEHPYHFVYDDGSRYFMFGQTYYELVQNARGGGGWRTSVDSSRAYGINKIRLGAYPIQDWPSPYPETSPFRGDYDRLDLEHWQQLDEVVRYLAERGVVADLMPYIASGAQRDAGFGTWEQDARYVRYLLARYAAFPNVIWCLVNEWNYSVKEAPYWNRLGRLVRAGDPYLERYEADVRYLRPLSIHQQTRIDFQFFDAGWPSHAIVQYGVRNGMRENDPPRTSTGDAWGRAAIRYNRERGMPVVNDEYGYIEEAGDYNREDNPLTRKKHRQVIWATYLAGGYGSVGDKRVRGSGRAWATGDWEPAEEYGDVRRLAGFFTAKGIAYWRMWSRDALAEGERVYVLAEPGQQYVAYAATGGAFTLALAPGTYEARRYDVRTGADVALGTVEGGRQRFELPSGEDGVVYLLRAEP